MITKYLSTTNYNHCTVTLEEQAFIFLCLHDRIYMFLIVDDSVKIENISATLASISTQNNRRRIIEELKQSSLQEEFDIKSFLWDLYLIIVCECNDKHTISPQKVNQIERDRFVARKIVVQGTEEEITAAFNKLFKGEETLKELLLQTQANFQPDQETLVADLTDNPDVTVKETITQELFTNNERTTQTIENYLVGIRTKYNTTDEDSRS